MAKKTKKPAISPETYHEDDRTMDAILEGMEHSGDVCAFCKHLYKDRVSCKAFPTTRGIPIEIFSGGVEHTEPYPGDNGIQFEVNPNGKEK